MCMCVSVHVCECVCVSVCVCMCECECVCACTSVYECVVAWLVGYTSLLCLVFQLLAVVYSNFAEEEKDKFRKLFLHKREALRHAFRVLTSPKGIEFHDFLIFMQHYRPRIRESVCTCQCACVHNYVCVWGWVFVCLCL